MDLYLDSSLRLQEVQTVEKLHVPSLSRVLTVPYIADINIGVLRVKMISNVQCIQFSVIMVCGRISLQDQVGLLQEPLY